MKQAIAFIVIVIVFLLPAEAFAVSDHIEYNISVSENGSALWTIIIVTDIDSSVDSWEEFEQRLLSTIDIAGERTNREMALDFASLIMNNEIHWETSSQTTTYTFRWLNFSAVEQGQISFGDVFGEKFFNSLYGDGELYVTYPLGYGVTSVSLLPDERDDSTQLLHWYRTQDFLVGDQNVSLEITGADIASNVNSNLFAVAVMGVGGFGSAVAAILIFKQRRGKTEIQQKLDKSSSWQKAESDPDKIMRLLQSSGGNLKQSEVCNKLRFSRAKTSLLLTEMEKNSLVKRYKKGKNKIIFSVKNKEGQDL
jgi:hypothetical protein